MLYTRVKRRRALEREKALVKNAQEPKKVEDNNNDTRTKVSKSKTKTK